MILYRFMIVYTHMIYLFTHKDIFVGFLDFVVFFNIYFQFLNISALSHCVFISMQFLHYLL